MANNNQLVQRAKLAEQIERYKDMADAMKEVAQQQKELATEERNLLSVAYKNVVGASRCSWRMMASIEQGGGDEIQPEATKYKKKIEDELNETCNEVQELLEKYLIPNAKDDDSEVFYWKMRGDYYRYQAEVAADKTSFIESSQNAYQKAWTIAEKMSPTNPIRLGLALNFSVFYFEIANNPSEARDLAKKALAAASDDQDKCETFKDSKLIMQLLHDNLTLWEMDVPREPEGEQEPEPQQPAEN